MTTAEKPNTNYTSVQTPNLTDPDDILRFTNSIRLRAIRDLTASGLPGERGDQALMAGLLSDLDKTALANKRINADKEISSGQSAAAAMALEIIKMLPTTAPVLAPDADRVPPSLGDDVPAPETVPGEMAIGIENLQYDSFMNPPTA